LYKPQMIDEGDCGAIGGMKIGRGNRSTRRKHDPAPLCPPQIPLDQTRAWTQAAAVGSHLSKSKPYEKHSVWSVRWAGRALGILVCDMCRRLKLKAQTLQLLQKVQENYLHRRYRCAVDVLLWTMTVTALIGRASVTRLLLTFRVKFLINFRTWGGLKILMMWGNMNGITRSWVLGVG
jgi:hypothetical protein